MLIKGEVRSAKVSRKLDEGGKEITVVDFRVKIPTGEKCPVREILDLTGQNAILNIEKAQLAIGD